MSTSKIPIIGAKGNKKMLLDALWVKFNCSEMDEIANISDLDFMRQIRFNQSSKEICKDYCPRVFLKIRQLLNIKEDDFKESLLDVNYDSLGDNLGKSGSSLFRTADKRYFIKTIDKSEKDFILQSLPSYYHYLEYNKGSFLLKILGVFRVRLDKIRSVHFMISVNVMPRKKKVTMMYDLKGSTVGRIHKEEVEEEHVEKEKKSVPILKDLNMIQSKKQFHFGKQHQKVMKQLYDDSNFLNSLGVIDYSLLIGIVTVTPPVPQLRKNTQHVSPSSSSPKQDEPKRKRPPSLHSLKNKQTISTVRQSLNEKRLSAMLETSDYLQMQLKNKLANNPFIQADQKRREQLGTSPNKLFTNTYWQKKLDGAQQQKKEQLTLKVPNRPPPSRPTKKKPPKKSSSPIKKVRPLPVGNHSEVNLSSDLKIENLNRKSKKRRPSMYVSNDNKEHTQEYENGLIGSSEIRKKEGLLAQVQSKLSSSESSTSASPNIFSSLISSIRQQFGTSSSTTTPTTPITSKNSTILDTNEDGAFRVSSTFIDKRNKQQKAPRELYIGIIDITQTYTIRKKAALAVRSIKHNKSELSSIEPELYAKRFQTFCGTFMVE